VSWWTDRHFFLLAVIAYGLSTVYSLLLWRKDFHRHDHVIYALLLAGLALQTKAMFMRGLSLKECPVHNLYEAMTFVDWTIVAAYLIFGLWPRLWYLGAFAAPVIFGLGVFALMPGLDPARTAPPMAGNQMVSLHAALTLLSYGAFGLSSVAAVMYLTQEHDLKFHKLRAVAALMPPMDRLEKITSRLLWAGFVLLTVGLAIIPFLLKNRPELRAAASDPKAIWSGLVWFLYLALLISHGRFAASGRKFAWGAVAGFAFVVLTFWGVNLLSPSHRF
jgi:HemX protein